MTQRAFDAVGGLIVGVSMLVGCVHPKPKPPAPQPTPTPEATMPGPGVPVAPEMLLRQDGGKLTGGVQAFGAVACCDQFNLNGQPVNSRWPMASTAWQDYTASFGANFWHARFGPFIGDADHESEWADVGGPYKPGTLEWNAQFWTLARGLGWHALYVRRGWYEVNPLDTWGCKFAQAGNSYIPWSAEEIAACGVRPSPEQERYIRKVVSEMGCYGNVIWLLDNEGGNVRGANAGWYRWQLGIIRDEEQRSGCGFVHMVGTNSGIEEVELFADYIVLHDRAPVTAPKFGRWTYNNERNPQFSPEQEAANFKASRDAGQAYAYWRAGMSDEEQERTLGLFRDVAAGAQTGCFAPPPEDEKWKAAPEPYNAGPVLGWLEQAKREVGDPKALPGATVWDRGLLALDLLGASLRRAGHCSSDRWRDALAVQGPDKRWYELHAVAFTDGGWSGQAFKGSVWSYQQ